MALNVKPKYVRRNDRFGNETRLVVEPHNIEVGAAQRQWGRTGQEWEAFGTFGTDALNVSGFKTESEALECAERWLINRLEEVKNATLFGMRDRVANPT